jgi:hypothetical protein
MPYILEVQQFYPDGHLLHPEWNGKSEHIGYLNIIFQTKIQACNYYDKHNAHLRSINLYKTLKSDSDPITNLQYIVRKYGNEYLKITPFGIDLQYNIIDKFIDEHICKTEINTDYIRKFDIIEHFKLWLCKYQKNVKFSKKLSQELFEIINKNFGLIDKQGKWKGIKILYTDDKNDTFDL